LFIENKGLTGNASVERKKRATIRASNPRSRTGKESETWESLPIIGNLKQTNDLATDTGHPKGLGTPARGRQWQGCGAPGQPFGLDGELVATT
jgi:hypothetical protein